MAGSLIKGLTIEIGADTQKFSKAVKDIDTQARTIAKDLKTVSESLKLNPKDAESYYYKLKLLEEAVSNAEKKVNSYKQAISKLRQQYADSEVKQSLYKQSVEELKQALESGKISQESYEKALKSVEDMYGKGLMSQKEYYDSLNALERQLASANLEYDRSVNALEKYQKETKDTSKDVDKLGDEQKETNKEVKNFKGPADEATGSAKSFGQSLKDFLTSDKIKNGFSNLVGYIKNVAKALFDAGKELFNFSKDAVSMAASYDDALGYSQTVFGEFSKSAQNWVESNSERLRIYKGDLLEYTNAFGQVFKTQGLAENEALEMSKQLISLSADIRAATGRDTTEINELLQRGFTSSLRNFRQLGVVMSEASVKAYALDKGLVTVNVDQTKLADATLKVAEAEKAATDALNKYGEESLEYQRAEVNLTKAEENLDKVLGGKLDTLDASTRSTAIYMMLMESLSNIVGQNERESSLYNSQLELTKTKLKNLKEEIGEQLLPTFNNLLTSFNEFLDTEEGQEIIQTIIDQFKEWGTSIDNIVKDGRLKKFVEDLIEKFPEVAEDVGEFTKRAIELIPELTKLADKILNIGNEIDKFTVKQAWSRAEYQVKKFADTYDVNLATVKSVVQSFADEHGISVADIYNDWVDYEPQIAQKLTDLQKEFGDNEVAINASLMAASDDVQTFANNVANTDTSGISGFIARVTQIIEDGVRGWNLILSGGLHLPGEISPVSEWIPNWIDNVMNLPGRAGGGDVRKNYPYKVNDDAGHRPEIFIPWENGTILNGNKTERILNNVNNSRTVGDLYIQVYTQSNTMTGTGEELGEAVLKKLRMSGVML